MVEGKKLSFVDMYSRKTLSAPLKPLLCLKFWQQNAALPFCLCILGELHTCLHPKTASSPRSHFPVVLVIRTESGFWSHLSTILVTSSENRKIFFLLAGQDRVILSSQQVRSSERAAQEQDSCYSALQLFPQEWGYVVFSGLKFCRYQGEGTFQSNAEQGKGLKVLFVFNKDTI